MANVFGPVGQWFNSGNSSSILLNEIPHFMGDVEKKIIEDVGDIYAGHRKLLRSKLFNTRIEKESSDKVDVYRFYFSGYFEIRAYDDKTEYNILINTRSGYGFTSKQRTKEDLIAEYNKTTPKEKCVLYKAIFRNIFKNRSKQRKSNFCLMRHKYSSGGSNLVLVDTEMTPKGNYAIYGTDMKYHTAMAARTLQYSYDYAPLADCMAFESKLGIKLEYGEDNPFLSGGK